MEIMTHGESNRETEIKLRLASAADGRLLLERAGLHVSRPRAFDDNCVFDTPTRSMRQSGTLLRIRIVDGEGTLTYKGPAAPGRYKVREELEAHTQDAVVLRTILERLGFREVFRYQKFRTEFRDDSNQGTATLDETPIGGFLELEGAPAWIDRTAQALGFSDADYVTASYLQLYLEFCAARGAAPGNMVFPESQIPADQETSISQPKPGRSEGRV